MPKYLGVYHDHFFLPDEGGGGSSGTPPPELPVLCVEEPSKFIPGVDNLLAFPGMDIENVWPSFKE
jgi:hypothetical protein